jgi:mannonate dehydratase
MGRVIAWDDLVSMEGKNMSRMTRRDCIVRGATIAAGAAAASTAWLRTARANSQGMKLAMILNPGEEGRAHMIRQMGVSHTIASVTGELAKVHRSEYEARLAQIKADFGKYGLTIDGVESHPVPAEKIKLGLDGRDEELENYVAAIKALSAIGIPMLCYNFMAGIGWYRTKFDAPERGGARTTLFDLREAEKEGLTKWGEISEEKIWDNMEYFQKAVMREAEKANIKMALHPDDPPLPSLRGIARICISADNFRRIMNIVPSPINGVTFCQANFVAMGEDIEALVREWGDEKKIFFVHFRDIRGQGEYFSETFHDNGPTDMAKMLKVYHESGFDGPIRPDHAPTMEGESNDRPGYAMAGKVLAIGYMKGVLTGMKIPHE